MVGVAIPVRRYVEVLARASIGAPTADPFA
jgi:hypothetical protein